MAQAARRVRRGAETPSARRAAAPSQARGQYASGRPDVNKFGYIAEYHEKVIKGGQKIIWKSLFLLNVRLFRAPGPAAALRCIRCTRRLVPRAVWRGRGDEACVDERFFLRLV